jgi:LETM1-like protein
VTTHLLDNGWLEALIADELVHHDPEAARARLPAELVRAGAPGADLAPAAQLLVARSLRARPVDLAAHDLRATFLDEIRLHVALVLDLALVRGEPVQPARQRSRIIAFLAAAAGEDELALAAYRADAPPRIVERVLRTAEKALKGELYPPGDVVHGLPLHPGHVAIQRRWLARVVMGHHRDGRLREESLARHRHYALGESALLVEAVAGLLEAVEPANERALSVRQRQLSRFALPRPWLKEARRALKAPRAPGELAEAAPEPVRAFLVEQLFLAMLRARLAGEAVTRFIEAFAAGARLDPAAVCAAQVEAAAQHGDHQVWFEAIEEEDPSAWEAFAAQWDVAADQIVERVSTAVTENFEAIVTEVRQTGELGALLAKAAAGTKLSADEKRKVRRQLLDLAKAVPALAIFAAPGGLLLLPLLAKLLPFNVLPSAWERVGAAKPRRALPPAGGTQPRTGGSR